MPWDWWKCAIHGGVIGLACGLGWSLSHPEYTARVQIYVPPRLSTARLLSDVVSQGRNEEAAVGPERSLDWVRLQLRSKQAVDSVYRFAKESGFSELEAAGLANCVEQESQFLVNGLTNDILEIWVKAGDSRSPLFVCQGLLFHMRETVATLRGQTGDSDTLSSLAEVAQELAKRERELVSSLLESKSNPLLAEPPLLGFRRAKYKEVTSRYRDLDGSYSDQRWLASSQVPGFTVLSPPHVVRSNSLRFVLWGLVTGIIVGILWAAKWPKAIFKKEKR